MTATHADRLHAIKSRLAAANLTDQVRARTGHEGARNVPLIDGGEGLDAEVVARVVEQAGPWRRAEFFAHAAADLRWAVEEIDFLRLYLAVLGDFALAADRYRWALEDTALGRVERCRQAFEEAQQELRAMPNWRPGECEHGCRRDATHQLVTEEDGQLERRPCCEECGSQWLATTRTVIDAGYRPAMTVRLEPLARPTHTAKEVVR